MLRLRFTAEYIKEVTEYRNNIYLIHSGELEKIELDQWGAGEYKVTKELKDNMILYVPFATYSTVEKAIVFTRYAKKQNKSINKTYIGYIAYGRQERETDNEPELLSPFISLIKSNLVHCEFIEPHKVTWETCSQLSALEYFNNSLERNNHLVKVVAPDKGAATKYRTLNIDTDIVIDKIRRDGKVYSEIGINKINHSEDNYPFEFHILDDICDGGRTFTNIAKLLKKQYPNSKVYLHVAHCIIPFGVYEIQLNGIDGIYCLNTCLPKGEHENGFVKVYEI